MIPTSVIIPAYNEEGSIGDVVRGIKALYPQFEILVVDDGSSDKTAEVAAEAGARVCAHPYNIGNGASVKTGIRMAEGEFLVFLDGDGQHDPRDIEAMLAYLPEYDMIVGQRRQGEQASFFRGAGNRFLNWLATYVAKFPIKDLTCGFRAIKAGIARDFISLLPNTYSYPTTITLSVLRDGRSLKYIPIRINTRYAGKSGIRLIRDGLKFIMIITKICTLYSPLRIFLPVSAGLFCLGWGYYLYTYITAGRFTNMSALLFTTSIIIFMIGLVSEQVSQVKFDRDSNHRFH